MHNFDPNIIIALISVLIAFASLIIATIRNGHTDRCGEATERGKTRRNA